MPSHHVRSKFIISPTGSRISTLAPPMTIEKLSYSSRDFFWLHEEAWVERGKNRNGDDQKDADITANPDLFGFFVKNRSLYLCQPWQPPVSSSVLIAPKISPAIIGRWVLVDSTYTPRAWAEAHGYPGLFSRINLVFGCTFGTLEDLRYAVALLSGALSVQTECAVVTLLPTDTLSLSVLDSDDLGTKKEIWVPNIRLEQNIAGHLIRTRQIEVVEWFETPLGEKIRRTMSYLAHRRERERKRETFSRK